MLLALVNGLLGGICGMWFRVQILAPLLVFVCIEVTVLKHAGTWGSVFWYAVMLIAATEIGYLAGASVAALRLSSERRTVPNDFADYQHNRSWSR